MQKATFLLIFVLFSFCKENNKLNTKKIIPKKEQIIELKSTDSNVKIDICENFVIEKIIKFLGQPDKIEKEELPDYKIGQDEEPWTVFYYPGLKISFIGNFVEEIVILNPDWEINELGIGKKFNLKEINLPVFNKKKDNYYLFNLDCLEGVLFIEKGQDDFISSIGISLQ